MSAMQTKPTKTKSDQLIVLLQRENGITIDALSKALNWKPHTTRAALTRLRQAGRTVEKLEPATGERASRYRVGAAKS